MSPRIIHIPLSGGDRKAQAKGIRYAHGIHNSYFKESILIRSAAEAKIREVGAGVSGGPSIRISPMSTGPSKRGKPSIHQKIETMSFNCFCFAG